jgi:hypothetical protein
MRRGTLALTPALITLLAILAFLTVLNFAISPTKTTNGNQSTDTANGDANAENTNDDRVLVTNANVSANTNAGANNSPSVNTNVVIDPTAGWKTYTDVQNRYTFRYPHDGILTIVDNVAPEVKWPDASFIVNVVENTFDPKATGEYALLETLSLSGRTWYVTSAGDGPCAWHDSITNFNSQRLNIRAGQCYAGPNFDQLESNQFKTDATLRNSILSTFTFTN